MKFARTSLEGAWIIEPELRGDERGYFARTMCRHEFAGHGLLIDFVQENMSVSRHAGTIRGLHFQQPPFAEAKLVRCVRGAVVDVIVDVRPDSPTHLQHVAVELSAENRRLLYVPEGLAHGFQTITPDVEVNYLVSAAYTPSVERGLRYNDPQLAISWPLPVSVISAKDANWPLLQQAGKPT